MKTTVTLFESSKQFDQVTTDKNVDFDYVEYKLARYYEDNEPTGTLWAEIEKEGEDFKERFTFRYGKGLTKTTVYKAQEEEVEGEQEEESQYITPTKERPIFEAVDTNYGYIDRRLYKDALLNNCCTTVFATSYSEAVEELHNYIKENYPNKADRKGAKFYINVVDGSLDKWGETLCKKVYTISGNKLQWL